jgi:thymidine kinase
MSLTLITGVMGAGKSSYLISVLNNEARSNFNVIYINSSTDSREFLTHCRTKFLSDNIQKYHTSDLASLSFPNFPPKGDAGTWVIGIDEAQFFHSLDKVVEWKDLGINVYVAGLVAKSDRSPFGHMASLLPHVTEPVHCKARCQRCLETKRKRVDAEHTYKKPEVKVNSEGVAVGGVESYFPVCNECYLILTRN